MRMAIVAAVACGLGGCAGPGPATRNPGIARFVGVWEGSAGGRAATLTVQPDQRGRLAIRTGDARPVETSGMLNPGSETLTFIEDSSRGSRVVIFATRADGTLGATVDGASMRFTLR